MARSMITNVSNGPVTLPAPYGTILGPGRSTIVADNPDNVLASFGGDEAVAGFVRVGFAPDNAQPSRPSVGGVFASISEGRNRAAVINDAIRAASLDFLARPRRWDLNVVKLRSLADYELETPIVLRTGVIVDCDGANIVSKFTGGADTVTNAAFVADGAIDTSKMNTTLTAVAPKNTNSIAVAAAGTIAAGDYILIQGRNPPYPDGDALLESSGTDVVLSEIVRVASSYAGGLTIPLAWPLRQHHAVTGITVRAITPVIGAGVRAARIWGSEGGVTTAVGVFGRYAMELEVSDLQASGLSRAAIDVVGVKGCDLRGYRNRGTNNAWLHATSVIGLKARDFDGYQGVDRVHPLGTPRYPILLRQRCTDVDLDDIHLTCTAAGMYITGGEHVHVEDLDVTDVSASTAVYDRMVVGGELQNGGALILGFGAGFGPLNIAEFGFDFTLGRLRCEDLRAPNEAAWTSGTPFRARAVLLHDMLGGHVGQISVVNRGVTDNDALVSGVTMSDYGGHIDSIFVAGYYYGLAFENFAADVVIDRYEFMGNAGTSPNATIPIYCNHQNPSAMTIHFREVSIGNAFSAFRTGPDFAGDFRFRIDLLSIDGNEWSDCMILGNLTVTDFATGDVVEADAASTNNTYQSIKSPDTGDAAHERRLFAVASGEDVTGSSYMLGNSLPARLATVMATAAEVNKGGVVEYAATRRAAQDAGAAHPIGRSLTYKAAGAEGLIRIGPVNG